MPGQVSEPMPRPFLGAAALVAIVALALMDPGTASVLERLHGPAILREAQRVAFAVAELRSNISISSGQVVVAVLVAAILSGGLTLAGMAAWRALSFAMKHDRTRRTAKEFAHATSLSEPANKVSKAQFSGWLDLLGRVSLGYAADAVNVVSALIIVLQYIGSNGTKHKMSLLIYIGFLVVALVQEAIRFRVQSRADDAINLEEYEAAPVGRTVAAGADGTVSGLSRTRAERLNLGALVRVRPGQRVPIDGYVVNVFGAGGPRADRVSPFAYAVTGEATVRAGVRPLPLAWADVRTVRCGVRLSSILQPGKGDAGPGGHPTDTAAGSGDPLHGRRRSSSDAEADAPRSREPRADPSVISRSASDGQPSPGPGGSAHRRVRSRLPSLRPALSGLPIGPGGGTDDAACPLVQSPSPSAVTTADAAHAAAAAAAGRLPVPSPALGDDDHPASPLARTRSAPTSAVRPVRRGLFGVERFREDLSSVVRGLAGAAPPRRLGAGRARSGSAGSLRGERVRLALSDDAGSSGAGQADQASAGPPGSEGGAPASPVPPVQILINGSLRPGPGSAVSRGMVHAPGSTSAGDLFLLAGVPAADDPDENNAAAPEPSEWDRVVRTVLIVQLVVAVAVSVQGWASGTVIRGVEVTAWSAAAFLLGQLVMNNGLVPIRAKLSVQFWMLAVKWYFGAVTVKQESVLETVRCTRDVVSDKTGTLTVDGMAFASPLPTPWTPGPEAAFHLLLTNDSAPNPLFRPRPAPGASAPTGAAPPCDPGLVRNPALATTTEEAVIFDALASDRHDSGRASLVGGDHLDGDASRPFPVVFRPVTVPGPDAAAPADSAPASRSRHRPPLLLACQAAPRTGAGAPVGPHPEGPEWNQPLPGALLALLHYRGPFEPVYIGRFAVATVFARHDADGTAEAVDDVARALARAAGEGLCGTAAGNGLVAAALAAGGWERRETVLAMQGGGDVVAGLCSDPRAADVERAELERDPNRTFGHAVAQLDAAPCGLSGALCRDDVIDLHEAALAAEGGPSGPEGSAGSASGYRLEFLSKFENPLNSDVHRVPSILAGQGVRFHCCTGDTLLTMRAILCRMGVTSPAQRVSGEAGFEFTPAEGPELAAAAERTAESCAGDDPARRDVLLRDLMRTSEVALGPAEADTIRHVLGGTALPAGSAVAADPLTCTERLLDAGRRVVVLCSQPALEALYDHRHSGRVRSILASPSVTMAFFRIRHNVKPKALALFTPTADTPEDAAREQAEADAGRVRCPAPVFIGDGTNDEPALLQTSHSIAIAQGSLAARNAANIEVRSAAALPDVVSMARLAHGGRAIVLRDVLFAGGYLVAMLAVSAHLVLFRPMAEGTIVIVEDPWNQLMTVLITLMIVTPRSLILAFTDGMQPAYRDHTTLVRACLVETLAAIAAAVWIGLHLAPENSVLDDPAALNDFAVMAVSSLALTMYLRQNLIISDEVTIRPRILPPIAFDGDDARDHGIPSSATAATRSPAHRHMPLVVWALTGVLSQVAVFLLFTALITSKHRGVLSVVWSVGSASLLPAAVMVAYRVVVAAAKALA